MIILIENRTRVAYAIDHGRVPKPPWALISIWSSTGTPLLTDNVLQLLDLHLGKPLVLSLCFDDVIESVGGYRLFSPHHAELVLDFADSAKDVETLVVQCDAGISRSAAVALFVAAHYNHDLAEFRRLNPFIVPNRLVIRMLNEAGWERA